MRLTTRLTVVTLLLVALAPAQAFAWANGPYRDGIRGQGYGSHDWVLDRAIELAGAQGDWVVRSAALGATDDPDFNGSPANYHTYRASGPSRGAAHGVSVAYAKAVAAYQAGDRAAASRYLGQLSHYYSDILQPFHTVDTSTRPGSLHWNYEQKVDDYQHKPGNVRAWITRRPAVPVGNVRKRTISAAAYARARYPELSSALRVSGSVTSGASGRITREVMSRAANDLADIIRTIPTGKGKAPAPTVTTIRVNHVHPAQYQSIGAFVRCLDSAGNPMEGVGVYFVWPTTSGTKRVRVYTAKDGTAHYYGAVGALPVNKRAYVKLEALGKVRAQSWFMPTRPLIDGTSGWAVALSDIRPAQQSVLQARARARDVSGRPVAGLKTTFTWTVGGKTTRYSSYTDAEGIARCSHDIGSAPIGVRAYVRGETEAAGRTRANMPSFVPAPSAVRATMYVNHVHPAQGQNIGAFVKCYDASGRPAGGTGVDIVWPTPTGVKRTRVYTASDGTAHLYGPVSTLPLYERSYVSVATNGSPLAQAWFMPTRPLADGLSGWSVTLSDRQPAPWSVVTATARARDTSGRAVAGLRTVFTWTVGGKASRYYAYTDAQGIARNSHNIGSAPVGATAYVRGETEAAGRTRANMPSFVPTAD